MHLASLVVAAKVRGMTGADVDSPLGVCLCGCGEPARVRYRPGHDQRHVDILVRQVRTGGSVDLLDALPTPALRAKAERLLGVAPGDATVGGEVRRLSRELAQMHPSDSSAQRSAEALILAALERSVGQRLTPGRLVLPGGAVVQVDGVCRDPDVLVEVFAHQGRLRGGQVHKVSADVLKLVTVRQLVLPDARLIVALADAQAAASVTGWRLESALAWGVEIVVVDLPEGERARLVQAQHRQRMVNAGESR